MEKLRKETELPADSGHAMGTAADARTAEEEGCAGRIGWPRTRGRQRRRDVPAGSGTRWARRCDDDGCRGGRERGAGEEGRCRVGEGEGDAASGEVAGWGTTGEGQTGGGGDEGRARARRRWVTTLRAGAGEDGCAVPARKGDAAGGWVAGGGGGGGGKIWQPFGVRLNRTKT
jgi:hypothetical protein